MRELKSVSWIVLLIVLIAGFIFVARVLYPFYAVILLALVTAGLVNPIYLRIVRAFKGHRRTAAIFLCTLLLFAFLGPISMIAQIVSKEAIGFYELTTSQLTKGQFVAQAEKRQAQLDHLNRYLEIFSIRLEASEVYDVLAAVGVNVGSFFYRQGVSVAKGLVRAVFGFFFWVVVLYYLLIDGEALRSWFKETLPLPEAQQDFLVHRFMDMASSLVVGNGFAALLQGTIGGLLFAILGLPGPVLWGVVMSILAFIPVVGISIVFVPVAIVLFLAGSTTKAMLVFFPLLIVSAIVEYWLKPMLVGRRAQMHTLLVFLSLIGGLEAFGAVGLLMGPLMMTAFITLVSIFKEKYTNNTINYSFYCYDLAIKNTDSQQATIT